MATVVTKDVGGTAKPVGVLYIEPDRQVVDAGAATTLSEAGVDPSFMADLLSACLSHERCGVHLYRSVAARTTMDSLRAQYEHFGAETLEHVALLEQLIAASGGDPSYVSPAARATEGAGAGLVEATFAIGGSIDPGTAELSMLESVLLAETKDRANWEVLAQVAERMADGPVKEQLTTIAAQVLAQEEEHHGWASSARAEMLLGLTLGGAA